MELLKIDYLGQPLRLEGTMAGWQELFWNNVLVSQKSASADPNGEFIHEFEIFITQPEEEQQQQPPQRIRCRIQVELQWQPLEVVYRLYADDEMMDNGKRCYRDIEPQTPQQIPAQKKNLSPLALMTLAVKLFKSAKVIKLVLAGGSLMLYSWLFSAKFAMALLITLMFHEYGHIQAMKHFGLKTKAIYLLPFFGGFALADEKVDTRWQAVVIALTGPCFGLLMSFFYLLVYGLSGELFFAALSVFNALVNLFNLLPILPLDGGQVLKHISFSMRSKSAMMVCAGVMALGVYISYQLELMLLALLLSVGYIEISSQWRHRCNSGLLPLDHNGQWFSALWYGSIVMGFIGIIWFFAGMGDDVLGLPLKILQS